MKRFFSLVILFCIVLTTCLGCSQIQKQNNYTTPDEQTDKYSSDTDDTKHEQEEPTLPNEPRKIINYSDFKAIWLSQFDLNAIYTNNGKQREITDFTNKIKTVLSQVSDFGFNTVIVQVRPYADSFYPSEYYPPSKYVTGSYKNGFDYDPVQIIIEEAHKLGISIHGWINPLRCMTTDEIKTIDNKYLIKQWYDSKDANGKFIVEFNGRYYLNPAYSETRGLIVSGVREIIDKYTFDGIHMDDYFYPTIDPSFDRDAYTEYSSQSYITLKEFRYMNLNSLVSELYLTVKERCADMLFGISPEGNMTNAADKAFADVYTWCSEAGYIDYICPQIYFGFEHQTHPFDKIADKWQSIITNDNVKLVIGVTLGKAQSKTDKWAGTGKDEWAGNDDILKRSVEYSESLDKCTGMAVFCYQYFYNPNNFTKIPETQNEINNFIPALKQANWN